MASKPKYKDAKTEYVRTPEPGIGLRKLAKQWDIPFGTLGTKSAKENWPTLRKAYNNKIDDQAEKQSIQFQGDVKSKIQQRTGASLDMASNIIHECLSILDGTPKTKADFIKFKTADIKLRSIKIATEALNNIDDRVKEIYGSDDSGSTTPADIASAVVALALSQGTIPTIPRSEVN